MEMKIIGVKVEFSNFVNQSRRTSLYKTIDKIIVIRAYKVTQPWKMSCAHMRAGWHQPKNLFGGVLNSRPCCSCGCGVPGCWTGGGTRLSLFIDHDESL
jgi:hypothetical protein